MNLFSLLSIIPNGLLSASSKMFGILIGILGIGFLIGFHELGHFVFAKLFNIRTPSFSIGFGPSLISKKIGETNFSLSAIPLGGYVELAHEDEDNNKKDTKSTSHTFTSRPYWQKLLVMLGGITFNLLFAYVAFILLFALGIPKSKYMLPLNSTSTIERVMDKSAASQAGLVKGDTILAVDAAPVENNVEALLKILRSNPDQTLTLSIKRAGQTMDIPVTLKSMDHLGKKIGILGIEFGSRSLPGVSFGQAIKKGIKTTNDWIKRTIGNYAHLFSSRSLSGAQGPLAIISETAKEGSQGFKQLLIFLAIISINLAILNLIPLPILDGGQILFYSIEALIGRSIPTNIKEYIQIGCWFLILGIILYASYNDILRILGFGK